MLRSNPSLSIFPVLAALFTIIASTPFVIAIAVSSGMQDKHPVFGPLHYALTFGMYFLNYLIVIYFNSALVACAHASLQGQPTSLNYGMHQANQRLPQIVGWALIASTVGTILRAISERSGLVGAIVSGIVGLVWNVAVFFVLPLLVIEKKGPVVALKESAKMLKQTWGERIILGAGMGTVTVLFALVGLIPVSVGIACFIAGHPALGLAALGVAVLYWILLTVVVSSLSMIFQTALFMYCRTGQAPAGFSNESVQSAFREKPASKFFGR